MMDYSKSSKNRGKIRTLKIIEEQREKTQFFNELIRELEQQLSKDHIDFLLQFVMSHGKNNKSKWLIADTNKQFKTPVISPTERSINQGITSSPSMSKTDLNIFHELYRSKEKAKKMDQDSSNRKQPDTLVNKEKRFIKQRIPKHLFEVDKKMKKNYQRIKTRLKFNSPQSTYRLSEQKKEWNLFSRSIKTQRKNRYKTQCQDEKQNRQTGDSIPMMLMGHLSSKNRNSWAFDKVESVWRDREDDRRWECFKTKIGKCGRRYRY